MREVHYAEDRRNLHVCKNAHIRELVGMTADTSMYANHYGQSGRDDTCRYLDQGELHFTYALRPYTGSWQGQKLPFVVETCKRGLILSPPNLPG